MKLEITKHQTISTGSGSIPTGEMTTFFWVKSEDNKISEPFKQETDAKAYYDGLVALYKKTGSFKPEAEVLSTTTL